MKTYWNKQLKGGYLHARLIWGQWAVGLVFEPGMYRPADRYDRPEIQTIGRYKYGSTEIGLLLGPIYLSWTW